MSAKVIGVRRWVAFTILAIALVAGGIFGVWAMNWSGHTVFGAARIPLKMAGDPSPVSLGGFTNGFASILKPALPAVVSIYSSKVVKAPTSDQMQPFFNDPMFRQFFGDQFGQQSQHPHSEREQSLGSGVIVSPDGYLLTNNHVVEGATDIKVALTDRREFTAKVIGTDPKTDIALLKIDATNLPTLALGDSSKIEVGDVVFAIGDPFGVGETATMGIVSAKNRGFNSQIEDYEDFIQTDAAINHGNSGGALIDLHGDLVGINTAILPGNGGGNQGIGFAIPINMAHIVMDQLAAHGKVVRGYLGIHIESVTPALQKSFGLPNANGALVGDVTADGPSGKAGLKRGDVITELNGQNIVDSNDLRLRVSETAPGTPVQLKVIRDGQPKNVSVTLGALPEKDEQAPATENKGSALDGVQVQTLTPEIAQELELPAGTHGVVVGSVDPSSPAAESGLSRGDVIQEVNHKPVSNSQEFEQAVSASKGTVLLLVNHGGVTAYIAIDGH
ncbi:MAG: DegQ family serine endoprotease [Candidatus Acidiferrales bacterium]